MRDEFFKTLFKLAVKDKDVMLLTSDTGAIYHDRFKKELKRQYINVGVAEQNMIGVAAGLAMSGKKVYVYGITPFVTLRCYEQIRVDLCSMNLPVTIVSIGAGFDYSTLGSTHHGTEDIAVMRALPNIKIYSPSDGLIIEDIIKSTYRDSSPSYIRLDRTGTPLVYKTKKDINFIKGFSVLKKGERMCLVATGRMVHNAWKISEKLNRHSINAGVMDLFRLKPLDAKEIYTHLKRYEWIISLEEHYTEGGIGSIISDLLAHRNRGPILKSFCIKDGICHGYGERVDLQKLCGIDIDSVTKFISKNFASI